MHLPSQTAPTVRVSGKLGDGRGQSLDIRLLSCNLVSTNRSIWGEMEQSYLLSKRDILHEWKAIFGFRGDSYFWVALRNTCDIQSAMSDCNSTLQLSPSFVLILKRREHFSLAQPKQLYFVLDSSFLLYLFFFQISISFSITIKIILHKE